MSVAALSLRTYARYVVPLTLLSVIAFAPIAYLGWKAGVPTSRNAAGSTMRLAWIIVGVGVVPLLVLVGGVAPAVRAVASGTAMSQLAVLRRGLGGLLRALVPCAIAACAIVMGSIALVLPGGALLVLFALTGASPERGVPGALADSVAVARMRANGFAILGVLAMMIVAQGAILLALQAGLVIPLPKKPTAAQLVGFRTLVRASALAIIVLAPAVATVLAAIHTRARAR